MTPGSVWAYVGVIRRHGLTRTVRIIRDRLSERYHERRLGIETAAFVEMRELGIENPGHLEYAPTPFRDFRAMLDRLAIDAGTDVFLDYGSGKGRALIMAAQYPFRRILGVEFSPQLSLIAARNIELARRQFVCPDVGTMVADAAAFEVPADVTVAYFNNPFEREIFAAVLGQLRRSTSSHPRRVRLVVNYPLGVEPALLRVIKQTDWLTIEDEFEPSPYRGCVIASNVR